LVNLFDFCLLVNLFLILLVHSSILCTHSIFSLTDWQMMTILFFFLLKKEPSEILETIWNPTLPLWSLTKLEVVQSTKFRTPLNFSDELVHNMMSLNKYKWYNLPLSLSNCPSRFNFRFGRTRLGNFPLILFCTSIILAKFSTSLLRSLTSWAMCARWSSAEWIIFHCWSVSKLCFSNSFSNNK